jgi:hypothetical protein
MAPDPSFLLGEHNARLNTIEERLERVDANVSYLVQRETVRDTKERQQSIYLASAGGFLGAILAFVASVVKDWLAR